MDDLTKKEVAALYRRAAQDELQGHKTYGYTTLMVPGPDDLVSSFNNLFCYWYEFECNKKAGALSLLLMADIVESEGWPLP